MSLKVQLWFCKHSNDNTSSSLQNPSGRMDTPRSWALCRKTYVRVLDICTSRMRPSRHRKFSRLRPTRPLPPPEPAPFLWQGFSSASLFRCFSSNLFSAFPLPSVHTASSALLWHDPLPRCAFHSSLQSCMYFSWSSLSYTMYLHYIYYIIEYITLDNILYYII